MKLPAAAALAVLAVFPPTLDAQTRLFAGRVVNAVTGEAVPNGTVTVRAAHVSDRLRPDGVFLLRLSPGEFTIHIQSVGFRTRDVTIPAGHDVAIIELVPAAVELDAVVVSGVGADVAERYAAVSVGRVRGEDVARVPATSLEETMRTKAAGVEIWQNSGAPADIQMRLRGVTTIIGNSQPLWILDGVIIRSAGVATGQSNLVGGQFSVPSRVADLNPNDIASIQVLRGAAATAMYGSKGSNGVVIVRTKRGG